MSWQNQSGKSKTLAAAAEKKRQRERFRRPLHIRRVDASLQKIEKDGTQSPIHGRVVLNDISPKGVGVYTDQMQPKGTTVLLSIPEPRPIAVRGIVVWSQKTGTSSVIIAKNALNIRMGIQFVFDNDAAHADFEKFCDDLFRHYLNLLPPEQAKEVAKEVQAEEQQLDAAPAEETEGGSEDGEGGALI